MCAIQQRFFLEKQWIIVIFSLTYVPTVTMYEYDGSLKWITFPIERCTLHAEDLQKRGAGKSCCSDSYAQVDGSN